MSRRLFEYALDRLDEGGDEKSLGQKNNGSWEFYTINDLVEKAYALAGGLLDLGLLPGDKVAMVSYKNCPEWMVVDMATQMIGIINVPLYPTISAKEYVYILNDAEVKAAFAGIGDLVDKLSTAQKDSPSLQHIYAMHDSGSDLYWDNIMNSGRREEIDEMANNITSDELATIIYTSGTTGHPKGVMLTHNNITAVVDNTALYLPVDNHDRVLSFLPLCHIFERAAIYVYILTKCEVYFTGTDNLGGPDGDLQDVKPHFFTTVPRLLEKVYEKILSKGMELTGLKKGLFFWALKMTDKYEHGKKFTGLAGIKQNLADKLIFSKWRDALGGNVKGIVTGAAPCPAKIARVFSGAGIPVLEGYGLTETSPTLTVNRLAENEAMIGSVGMVINDVELKIDDSDGDYNPGEGEILARGPNVMQGYYNKPKESAEVFKVIDGVRWFRTGDVGKFIIGPGGNQFLKITDRKKQLLKTSGGKYVAPAPIESKFKEDFMIEHMMVVGDSRKFVSALIIPAEEALKDWCKKEGITWNGIEEAVKHPKVTARYQRCCDRYNPGFSHIEQIKKFTLLPTTWEAVRSDGTDTELTPTMKLKRRVIHEKYADAIEELYAD